MNNEKRLKSCEASECVFQSRVGLKVFTACKDREVRDQRDRSGICLELYPFFRETFGQALS